MTTCLDGDGGSEVLRVAAPAVLDGQLYASGFLVGLHVNVEYVVALVKLVVTAGNHEELVPGSIGLIVQGSVLDGRCTTTHNVVGEAAVGLVLVGVEVDFLFYLDSRALELVESYALDGV